MARQPRFRGENFRGKWGLGSWAERLIVDAVNRSEDFRAVPYGKSEVGPTSREEIRAYWSDHLAREVRGKRPDVLVFARERFEELSRDRSAAESLHKLPQYAEDEIEFIVRAALLGVEAEASIWQGKKMDDYGRAWDKPVGRRKAARDIKKWVAPTVIVKKEDVEPLLNWQKSYGKSIYVVHVFYDLAYMLDLGRLLHYIEEGTVSAEVYEYDRVKKPIYKTFYGLASVFGEFTELAEVVSFAYQTKGGKFKSDLYFEGGRLSLSQTAVEEWRALTHTSPEATW